MCSFWQRRAADAHKTGLITRHVGGDGGLKHEGRVKVYHVCKRACEDDVKMGVICIRYTYIGTYLHTYLTRDGGLAMQ